MEPGKELQDMGVQEIEQLRRATKENSWYQSSTSLKVKLLRVGWGGGCLLDLAVERTHAAEQV